MKDDVTKPLPCPFCGLIPMQESHSGKDWVWHKPVGCAMDGFDLTIERWNRRRPAEDGLAREAVAQLEVRNDIAGLKHLLVHIGEVSDGMMLYRSPPLEPPREMTMADDVPKGYSPDGQYAWKAGWNACVGYITGKRELTQDVAELLKSARGTKHG